MTLKQLAEKFVSEIRAGQIGEALDTAAEILKSSAGFYKLLFGVGTVATETGDGDLAGIEDELKNVYDEAATATWAAADGAPKAVDPALILMVVNLILKLIQERRKNRQ